MDIWYDPVRQMQKEVEDAPVKERVNSFHFRKKQSEGEGGGL